MRLLQGLLLAVVVLDATLVLTATAAPTTGGEQITANESTVGPNGALMASR